jgi:O-antigen ligase
VVLRRLDYRILAISVVVAAGYSIALWFMCSGTPLPYRVLEGATAVDATTTLTAALGGSPASATHRLTIIDRALSLWQESPILGSGVGTYIARQRPTADDPLATIHSSYLWLLTETGIIGLSLFIAFFGVAFLLLLRARNDPRFGDLIAGTAALVVSFAAVALAMEALYQRHLWLLLGAALGLANLGRPSPDEDRRPQRLITG